MIQKHKRNLVERSPDLFFFYIVSLFPSHHPFHYSPFSKSWRAYRLSDSLQTSGRITFKDVVGAVSQSSGGKAPGPESFTAEFYKRFCFSVTSSND